MKTTITSSILGAVSGVGTYDLLEDSVVHDNPVTDTGIKIVLALVMSVVIPWLNDIRRERKEKRAKRKSDKLKEQNDRNK